MKPITILAATLLGVSLAFLSGCTSVSLTAKDSAGNTVGSLTDSNPMNSVDSLSAGPGCTVPDPYVPPAPPPAKVVAARSLCDNTGHNCQEFLLPVATDPSTVCNVVVAQTKGLGFAPYLAVGASIFAMIGLALGGF